MLSVILFAIVLALAILVKLAMYSHECNRVMREAMNLADDGYEVWVIG